MVLCETDENLMLVEPMKNRTLGEMWRVYEKLMQQLILSNIEIKKNILDKKVTPNKHCCNIAKKAISISKEHFKAILTAIYKRFSLQLWERLPSQAESTLNKLRPSNIVPKISAYAYMYGQHDYNKMQLASMGCVMMVNNKPSKQQESIIGDIKSGSKTQEEYGLPTKSFSNTRTSQFQDKQRQFP